MPKIELRARFAVNDAVLSELHSRAFAYPGPAPTVAPQPWAARLERHSLTWIGGFVGDELMGFVHACWDGGSHAFLLDAVVAPECRRRGLGTRLVASVVQKAGESGCEWLHVDFGPHLALFYASAGFRPTSAGLIHLRS